MAKACDWGLREFTVDALPSAVVVVHAAGTVALVNLAARRLFGLSSADVGRPLQDLEISHRPAELWSAVEQVAKEQLPVILEQAPWPGRDADCFDIHLVPVTDSGGATVGVAISFIDITESRRLHEQLELSNRGLETAYGEVQATVAELEATNEELQSTNEELETINAELRRRTAELDEVHGFLGSLLASHRGALVVVDRDLRVSVWNDHSAELWGLRPEDVPGRHFLNLGIGLPVEALRGPIRAVLAGDTQEEVLILEATNRRGRELLCRVTLTPLVDRDREVRGAIIAMAETTGDGS